MDGNLRGVPTRLVLLLLTHQSLGETLIAIGEFCLARPNEMSLPLLLGQRIGNIEAVGAVAGSTLPGIIAPHEVQQGRVRVGPDQARLSHACVIILFLVDCGVGGEGDALVGQLGVVHPAVHVAVVGEVVLQRPDVGHPHLEGV